MAEKVSMHRVMVVLLLAASCALGACASKQPKPARPASAEHGEQRSAQGAGAEQLQRRRRRRR